MRSYGTLQQKAFRALADTQLKLGVVLRIAAGQIFERKCC